jgi:RimJ/RimL family protein N-acetyltransferase
MTVQLPHSSIRLEGERLILRPVCREDAPEAFRLVHGREEILRWLLWRGPSEVAELEESFASWSRITDGVADYLLAVVERKSGAFVGTIGARFSGHPDMGDLGYWLGEHVWGRGYATEAIDLVTRFCFEELQANSLFAWVFVGNEGSRCALEKNGFSLLRTELQRMEQDGVARDEWYYVLLRSEWLRLQEA